MQVFKGTAISKGLALGRARYFLRNALELPQGKIKEEEIQQELRNFEEAQEKCVIELEGFLGDEHITDGEREILGTHLEILLDPELIGQIKSAIQTEHKYAAQGIDEVFSKTVEFFRSMGNEIFAERAADFLDVRSRLLHEILGEKQSSLQDLEEDAIPIFREIHPSEVSLMKKMGISACICENLSYTAHAAILSRGLKIGCVANIEDLEEKVKEDDCIIVDGESGQVIREPEDEDLEYFAQKLQIQDMIYHKQLQLKSIACETKDKHAIRLDLNIGMPEEIDQVSELDSSGVGLFRTEFLILNAEHLPSEEEQCKVYTQMAQKISPKTLTIRSFDIGGDKLSHLVPGVKEDNPYLGNRGIRLLLSYPHIMRSQLRAILRASAFGKIKLMFPMVIDVDDFLAAKAMVKSCADELYAEGIDYDKDLPLGCMIEIPAAALSSDSLARECDFLSIGTNDLVQYTLAVDRNNEAVSRYYIHHHPAVLKLIRATLINAVKHGKPVSICGEMASIKEYVPLLIGMGVRELSVNPGAYYDVKAVIPRCDEKLAMIVRNFDFSTSLPKVDELVYRTLKQYYVEREHQ